ncbi:MAG: type II secretion system minor pseudopilin GspJ [Gammaproteobacteria bacterium]|nr:type II secretion system minor pseudopilin GspJ [Gammaproteobacteria bacterium]
MTAPPKLNNSQFHHSMTPPHSNHRPASLSTAIKAKAAQTASHHTTSAVSLVAPARVSGVGAAGAVGLMAPARVSGVGAASAVGLVVPARVSGIRAASAVGLVAPARASGVRAASAGFTLIELLLAVSIFSVIAIAGVYVLRQAIVGSEQQIAVVNSTSELQQALWLMSQDMYNLIDREAQVGDKTELPLHTKQEGEDNPLGDKYNILFNLTRLSWIDTRYKYTSQLLRVAYALKLDSETGLKQLVRLHWPYVDRTRTQKPLERVLINGVREAEVSFYSEGKKDIKKWPLEKPKNNDTIDEDAPPRFPDGLKFSLNIDGFGKFEKIISVNIGTIHVEVEAEESEEENEDRKSDELNR